MWFDAWSGVLRIVVVGSAAYAALVVLLRVSGKRTLAKLNAFDFVVTVALGSTLSSILLDSRVAWAEGVTALLLLILLQLVVAAVTSRIESLRGVVTAKPTVILLDGQPREEVMHRCRVGMAELRQAVRATGTGDLASVSVVVLETDGSLSVISREKRGDGSALAGIES